MGLNQTTLRSFLNIEGRLMLCNEPFFLHFGHCTQHLIGKSVTEVFSSDKSVEILQAVRNCHLYPEQSFTIDMQKPCKEGCQAFRWMIYAEQQQGRITGVHLVGCYLGTGTTA